MKSPLQFSYAYIGADLFLIALSSYMGGLWLINTQAAFICSMLITYASFFSYKKMVDKRVDGGEKIKEHDPLDKIDDRYELFEEEGEVLNEELSVEEFKALVKEEKKKVGNFKQSGKNFFTSMTGMLSPYRLLSYGFLFVTFLYLTRHGWFDAIAFLLGLAVVPVVSTFLILKTR